MPTKARIVRVELLPEIERKLVLVGDDFVSLRSVSLILHRERNSFRDHRATLERRQRVEADFRDLNRYCAERRNENGNLYGYDPRTLAIVGGSKKCGAAIGTEHVLALINDRISLRWPESPPETQRRDALILKVTHDKLAELTHPAETPEEIINRLSRSDVRGKVPRTPFPEPTLKLFEAVLRSYGGECPDGCRRRVLDASGNILLESRGRIVDVDHTAGSNHVGPNQGWMIHHACNSAIQAAEDRGDWHIADELRAAFPEFKRRVMKLVPRQTGFGFQ